MSNLSITTTTTAHATTETTVLNGEPKVFEIELPGFCGSSDDTDHLILWVEAVFQAQVEAVLAQVAPGSTVFSFSRSAKLRPSDRDFSLPAQAAEMVDAVRRLITTA